MSRAPQPPRSPSAAEVRAPREPQQQGRVRPEHLYKTALLVFLLALFFRFFREVTQVLLLVYAAAIVAVALNPLVQRIPLGRRWVAALAGVLALGLLGLILWLGVPAMLGQLRELGEQWPELQQRMEGWGEWIRQETGLNIALLSEQAAQMVSGMFQGLGTDEVLGRARGLLEVLLVPFVILMGGLYALANPNNRLMIPLLRLIPAPRRSAYYRILQLLGERLFGWIRGTLIAMLGVGVLSTAALYLIGVPYWLVLGTIVGIFEFIPIFGPWLGGVPVVLIAFLDEPIKGVWSALAIIVIQQIESYLITPWAMSTAAKIHPVVTLFALIIFGSIFGVLGILLALPLVILIWTVVEVLWVERSLGSQADWVPPVVEE